MDNASMIAVSRLIAQQRAMSVTANNIANANTAGYKEERVLFSDWLSRQTGTSGPRGGQVVSFVQDRATYNDRRQGALTHTGNPFDLAISGDGYFTVSTPQGPRLTRAGRFGLLQDGTVADDVGDALLDTNGKKIQLAPTDTRITVAGDGTISSENGQLSKIGVVNPADPMRLAAEGGAVSRADTPTSAVAQPKIVQGAVEDSNVQPVIEMTKMMQDLHSFQFVTQFVQAEQDRHQNAIEKVLPPSS
jgi:flagellar basal-body rod protein FlgF